MGAGDPSVSYHDLVTGLRSLNIDPSQPVIVHSSLSAFGYVAGGAQTVLGCLLALYPVLIMPTFTYKTMVVPETGPENNGITYGSASTLNAMAEFFRMDMPADHLMGILAETLRRHTKAKRSAHPILSFSGINAEEFLAVQTLEEPLAPIHKAWEAQGTVLLLGVDQTTNTSIHLGEHLAGRRQFTRWALTPVGITACPHFPGCSDGFESIIPEIKNSLRRVSVGAALIQAVPLVDLIEATRRVIQNDPLALLCEKFYCERCRTVRDHPETG